MKNQSKPKASAKAQRVFNLILRIIGYLMLIAILVSTTTFWIISDYKHVAQVFSIGALLSPVLGVVIFLCGLFSRWSHKTNKHNEIVGIATIFVWIYPMVMLFAM